MKRTMIITGFAAVIVMLGTADLMAQGKGRGMRQGPRAINSPVTPMVNLTAEQQLKIAKLRAEKIKKMASPQAQLQVLRSEMRAIWLSDSPDRKKIAAKQAKMDVVRKQLREIRMDFRLAVHRLLTPEQRAGFVNTIGPASRGFGRGRGMGPCGMGQGRRGWGRGGGGGGRGWGGGGW